MRHLCRGWRLNLELRAGTEMSIQGVLTEIRKIASGLDPGEIRAAAARPLRIGLAATSEEAFQGMERFLCTGIADEDALAHAAGIINRVELANAADCDVVLCEANSTLGPLPGKGYRFHPRDPLWTVEAIIEAQRDLELALARNFPAFRKPVAEKIIHRISTENALFALVSALPNVVPNFLEVPWAVGEFATDTAFLTMNQVRMALQLAAAHGRPVGYAEQKLQIASIAGGAFGWRALARELVGKIPLGGGLIPKAGIAFAGTWILGLGLERVNRMDPMMSKRERREAYAAALAKGRAIAKDLVPVLSRPRG